jgi:hypothetical protein
MVRLSRTERDRMLSKVRSGMPGSGDTRKGVT